MLSLSTCFFSLGQSLSVPAVEVEKHSSLEWSGPWISFEVWMFFFGGHGGHWKKTGAWTKEVFKTHRNRCPLIPRLPRAHCEHWYTPVGAHHTKATSATYYVPSFFALLPGLPLREYRQCCPGFFGRASTYYKMEPHQHCLLVFQGWSPYMMRWVGCFVGDGGFTLRSCSLNSMEKKIWSSIFSSDHSSDFSMDVSCKARCHNHAGAKVV